MRLLGTIGMLVLGAVVFAPHADAADLGPRPSRVGAIFAEPVPPAASVHVYERVDPVFVGTALKVPGYYGKPTDFEYRNYYGTSPVTIYSRLPYACGFVGLC